MTAPEASPLIASSRVGEIRRLVGSDTAAAGLAIAHTLDRVTRVDGRVRALVDEPDRPGRIAAELSTLDERGVGSRCALFGLSVGVKDIIRAEGLPTRAGSALPTAEFEGPEASAVGRLRSAGGLVLGKTTTTEFAFSEPPPTVNPHAPEHTPGGSSSGSAAAVAAGIAPLALGSQTVDSIITPAAYCGVVGFKPTFERVGIDGVVPFAPSMDTLGGMSQDVEGITLLASVICDSWRPSPTKAPAVLGLPSKAFLHAATPRALTAFRVAIDRLSEIGWTFVATDALENFTEILGRHRRLIAREFADQHREWFMRYGDRYRPKTAALFAEGSALDRRAIHDGLDGAERLRRELTDATDRHGIDAWVSPATTGPAPRGLAYIGDPTMATPWTHARLPAVTVPGPPASDGLPLGIQLVGRSGADEALLAVAQSIEDSRAQR